MSSSLTVLAAGQLGLLDRNEMASSGAAAGDLLEALGRVPDPRDPRGRRYPLAGVLAIAVCPVLAGARSYQAIAEWAGDARPALRARLGLPGAVPDLATIWRVLTTVDPVALDAAIGTWASAQLAVRCPPAGRVVLAVDGNTVRGARAAGGSAPHLLACLDHGTGVVLAQAAVDGKTNEIPMFAVLLGQAGDLGEVLVTADALHAQREHADWLHGRGAHYLVTVKANQPGLLRQLRSLPWKQVPAGHVSDGRGHGRIEKRIVKVVTVTCRRAAAMLACPARRRMLMTRFRMAATGRSRTSSTGYATSPSARTPPSPAPAPARTSFSQY
jgi:hypothetical protein